MIIWALATVGSKSRTNVHKVAPKDSAFCPDTMLDNAAKTNNAIAGMIMNRMIAAKKLDIDPDIFKAFVKWSGTHIIIDSETDHSERIS